MGLSASNLLDESKCSRIRAQADAELRGFGPHYKRQYSAAFFSRLYDEVERHGPSRTQLLRQRDQHPAGEILYGENILHLDDARKWKERFVVVRADYSLECHDSYESFTKGLPPRQRLLPTGGVVLTSEDKYTAAVDRCFPHSSGVKEKCAPPMVVMPGRFPVYVSLPYRRDSCFCFHSEEQRSAFISVLTDCIRHQNHDFEKKASHDVQAFLKAVQFYREEKGRCESWDMLVGSDVPVLANLVMEELLPSLETELLPRLKGKEADRRRTWFATVEAAYLLVQEQLLKGFAALKEECQVVAKQQEVLIRSHMDQIASSRAFLEAKLKATALEPAVRYCSENVQPRLASILEEIMGPVSSGFQQVRLLLDNEIDRLCQHVQAVRSAEELEQALERLRKADLQGCYRRVDGLREPLPALRDRFGFSRSDRLVHSAQLDMQQLMQNAVYTLELLLDTALKEHPADPRLAMEKAKRRVLKQYDHDSTTVRKRIFRDALVGIALATIKENLAPTCKPELHAFEQHVFADYADFIHVENVYEDILLQVLDSEISRVVKEAERRHDLFLDSAEPHFISQSSLGDSWTPPKSSPASSSRAPATSTPWQTEGPPDAPGKSEQDETVESAKAMQTVNGTEADETSSAPVEKVNAEDELGSPGFDEHEIDVQTPAPGAEKDPLGDVPQSVKMAVNEMPSVLLKENMKTDEEEEMNEVSSTAQIEEMATDAASRSNHPEDVNKTDADEKATGQQVVLSAAAPETQTAVHGTSPAHPAKDGAPSSGQRGPTDAVHLGSGSTSLHLDSDSETRAIAVHVTDEDSTAPCVVFRDPKEAVAIRPVPSVGFTGGSVAGPAAEGTKSDGPPSSDLAAHLSESVTEETKSWARCRVESHAEAESTEEAAPTGQRSSSLRVDILGMEAEEAIQDLPLKALQQFPGESDA